MPGPKILKETDTHFTIAHPETGEPEDHPKQPGVMDRMLEGLKGQNASGDITNKYMENLASIRKQKGWIK